jgi:dTDP-4-amino-4,6-dideoxygalactose transaminase
MLPFFSSKTVHDTLNAEIQLAWQRFYASNYYVLGTEVKAFEAEYASWIGAKHCIGVANGLDALHISLRALGIGPGDEVIVPSNTYIASWLGVSQTGAKPVPVEPDPRSWNLDPRRIEAAITPRTKAIMPVHLYGQACEMGPIMELAQKHGLKVVEDNAQAHGATWNGQKTGTFGQLNAHSFYPTKNLGALGDAGAVTCDEEDFADFARTFRNYGSKERYYNEMQGTNSRLDELQAAILQVKLRYLHQWNEERSILAQQYLDALADLDEVQLPHILEGATHVWHLFVILTPKRDALQAFLAQKGLQTLIHYPLPPHLQKAYQGAGYQKGQFPLAEKMATECLSLPLFPGMDAIHQGQVIEGIKAFFGQK